jgi:hypothetical protein
MLMLGMSSVSLFSADAPSPKNEVEALQKQIEVLQKQLETIAKQVNEQSNQVKEIKSENKQIKEHRPAAAITAASPEPKDNTPVFEKGYIAIPGTTAAVKINGMVKLDMIRDAKAYTGEQTNVSRMPYALQMRNANLPNVPMKWKGHSYLHAKQSRFRVESLVKNKSGNDVKTFVEADFFGAPQWGDGFPNGPSAGQSSNTYTLRLRHAVIGYGGLEAGHTTSTFQITESQLPSVDLNGLTDGYARHALIRYTQKLGNFALTAAAEHGRADYATFTPTPTPTVNGGSATTPNYAYNNQDSPGNLSKQARPDFILRAKYNFENGSTVGLSFLNRDLQLKNNVRINGNNQATVDGRNYSTNAWGMNLAAKIMTFGKSFFTTGITTGQGIGWYILEGQGRSALFDPTAAEGQRYKSITMHMYWAGYSHVWNQQWQTNFGAARIDFRTQRLANARGVTQWFDPGLDKAFNKYLVNTMYSPEENLQFGLEYYVLQRKSTLGYRGLGQRLQFGASYKF